MATRDVKDVVRLRGQLVESRLVLGTGLEHKEPGGGRRGYRREQRWVFSKSLHRRTGSADLAKDDGDAQFLSAKYFLPAMRKKRWGRFIGISSNMVGLAILGMSHYIATKMGIIGFMRGLANDVASDGINCKRGLTRSHEHTGHRAAIGRAKTLHLGTASDQAVGRTRGCYWSDSVLNKRRCRLYHCSGNRRGRRSVSDRLTHRSTLLAAGPGDRSWTPGFRSS